MGFPKTKNLFWLWASTLLFGERQIVVYEWWWKDKRPKWDSDLSDWASLGPLLNGQIFLAASVLYNGTVFVIRSGLSLKKAPAGFNTLVHTHFGGRLIRAAWFVKRTSAGIGWRYFSSVLWNYPSEVSSWIVTHQSPWYKKRSPFFRSINSP